MYQRNVFYTCLIIALFSVPLWIDFAAKQRLEDSPKSQNSPIKIKSIQFWQYWAGEEKEALVNLVNKFNNEGHGFNVQVQSISLPRKKIMMAVAANLSPDLVLLDGDMVSDFALRNALINITHDNRLNDAFKEIRPKETKLGLKLEELYLKTEAKILKPYREMLYIKDSQVALPLMPTAEALHINKSLLKKHKLKSPESLDDLIQVSRQITKNSNFQEFGWLPTWPIWSGRFIVTAFNGKWAEKKADGSYQITANHPNNIQAWDWVLENFIKEIPPDKLQGFIEGNISYQSPDNPFYSGKVALETSGIWEYGFTKKFSPDYDIEVKAFPSNSKTILNTSQASTEIAVDALAIPRGAKYKSEALYFMLWLLKEENISYLALAQNKFPPIELSSVLKEDFIRKHKNPYIKVFLNLAKSPNATYFPHLSFSKEYKREIKKAFDRVLRLEASPKQSLDDLQKKILSVQKRSI